MNQHSYSGYINRQMLGNYSFHEHIFSLLMISHYFVIPPSRCATALVQYYLGRYLSKLEIRVQYCVSRHIYIHLRHLRARLLPSPYVSLWILARLHKVTSSLDKLLLS